LNGGLGNILPGFGGGFGYGGNRMGYVGGAHGLLKEGEMDRYVIENERRIAHLQSEVAAIKVADTKNAEIAFLKDQLTQANVLRYVDDKTCGMIKGHPYISPRQMADPYMGQRQVISTHRPVVEIDRRHDGCCDGNDWDRFY
jgi:hypothetical protein